MQDNWTIANNELVSRKGAVVAKARKICPWPNLERRTFRIQVTTLSHLGLLHSMELREHWENCNLRITTKQITVRKIQHMKKSTCSLSRTGQWTWQHVLLCSAQHITSTKKVVFLVHAKKEYRGGSQVQLQSSWTLALVGDEWSTSRPGHFTLGKEPRYPLHRSLCEPHNRSRRSEEEKISYSCRESNPRFYGPERTHY